MQLHSSTKKQYCDTATMGAKRKARVIQTFDGEAGIEDTEPEGKLPCSLFDTPLCLSMLPYLLI
jgi:hypothetical protein